MVLPAVLPLFAALLVAHPDKANTDAAIIPVLIIVFRNFFAILVPPLRLSANCH